VLFVYYDFVNQHQQMVQQPLRRTLQQLYIAPQNNTRCRATGFIFLNQ
jgi:hypothetical protein